MNKYLLLTDSHINENNIEVVTSCFNQVIEYCKENYIKTVFHLGDWFTSRKSQSLIVLKATEHIILSLYEAGLTTYIIKGNHDAVDLESTHSYIDIFDNPHLNFNVIREEKNIEFGKINFCFLPYFKENGSYTERLSKIGLSDIKINILLTHTSVSGVKNNDGTEVCNELSKNTFKSFYKVFTGHYHQRSQIGDNIFYMGSLYQGNFGEDDMKGFVVLSEDGEHSYFETKFPKYIKYAVNPKDITAKDILEIKKEKQESGDNIRIELTGTDAEIKSFNKQVLQDAGVSVTHKADAIVKEDVEADVEAFDVVSLQQEFDKYCDKNELDKAAGQKYFNKVISA